MNNQTTEVIPTQGSGILPNGNASTIVAQTREMAEAIAAVQMAKQFPRNIVEARDRILNACTRPTLAESACYTYARGGTEVTGPSIRLAETLAQNWGNISFGVRELEQRNGESTCEAFAWDMETNSRQVKVFQVSHIRHTKKGDTLLTDPRDIYELVANNGARRVRACILGIIPGDIVEEAVKACETTLATKFTVTPERIKALIEKFSALGVTKEQIEKRIQRNIESILPAQLADLGKKYNSIKDGMSKPEDWFEIVPKATEPTTHSEGAKSEKKALAEKLGLKKGSEILTPSPKPDGESSVEDVI